MSSIVDWVGISTNTLSGIDIWEAIRLTREYELKCFEIHLGDFEGAVGNPWMIPHAGVWPRTCGADTRERLREALSHIEHLTIHGTPVDLNIAALNPAVREESCRQYREAMDLARDLGARTVTFHEGQPSLSVVSPDWVEDCNVEFIHSILDRAAEYEISIGFESFNTRLLERIADSRFGLLLDTGHAVMAPNRFAPQGRGDTRTVTSWIAFLADRLVELHLHNVINWAEAPSHGMAHRSFEYGLCLDLDGIIEALKMNGRRIPLVSEIYEPDARNAARGAARLRDRIGEIWG